MSTNKLSNMVKYRTNRLHAHLHELLGNFKLPGVFVVTRLLKFQLFQSEKTFDVINPLICHIPHLQNVFSQFTDLSSVMMMVMQSHFKRGLSLYEKPPSLNTPFLSFGCNKSVNQSRNNSNGIINP